jgi:dienelactone hydrolase
MAQRQRVEFASGQDVCVGYVYPPARADAPEAACCIVMAHGFGGTQEGSLARSAADFAAAGFTAFSFDYRGLGESGGEPRQVIDIRAQHADWHAAIAFARTLPGVRADRVALWGSSLGGGHVLSVAQQDPTIAAVVAQIPFIRFPRKVEGRTPRETRRLMGAIFADWWAGRTGRPPRYIKAAGLPGELAVMATPEAAHTVAVLDNPTWKNEVAPRVLLDMSLWYRPGAHADRMAMPVLFSLAEGDREGPADITRPAAFRAPRGQLRSYPCNHFQFYDEAVRPTVVADQVSFLRAHLVGFPGLSA